MSDSLSRRRFLASTAVALGAAPIIAACGGGGAPTTASACDGYTDLTPAQLQSRQALQYADQTTREDQNCANCRLYNAPATEGGCGGCQLFQGPVVPGGWCSGWVAQAA